jgi:Uma2 family endonuclease
MDLQTQIAHNSPTETLEPRSELEIQYELERNKPMPSLNHARVQSRIIKHLAIAYDQEYDILSELTIAFPVKPAVPDVCIYPITQPVWHKDVVKKQDFPLLVIEILSSKQAFDEIVDKINDIYFPAGVPSAWVILPSAQSVMIFTPNEKPKTYASGIMKDEASGFEIDLDKVF